MLLSLPNYFSMFSLFSTHRTEHSKFEGDRLFIPTKHKRPSPSPPTSTASSALVLIQELGMCRHCSALTSSKTPKRPFRRLLLVSFSSVFPSTWNSKAKLSICITITAIKFIQSVLSQALDPQPGKCGLVVWPLLNTMTMGEQCQCTPR